MVKITVNITPKPAPRPRVNQYGVVYMPKDYKEYITEIQHQANKYLLNYVSNELLVMDVVFRKNANPRHKRFGDADNLLKGIMDALIGYAYFDDAQIIKCTVSKVQSSDEGIDIKLSTIGE